MKQKLNILIVEDSEDDALLIVHQISKGNYDVFYKIVDSPETLKSALITNNWDIILSDYQMPNFSGLDALILLHESGLDLPFIIISGAIGEEVAVHAMKAGAHDYIMKDNLKRLLPAVVRELSEFQIRKEREQLKEKQQEAEERYRLIAQNTADTITLLDLDLNIVYVSPSVQRLRGYTVQETIKQTIEQFLTPQSLQKTKNILAKQIEIEKWNKADPNRSVLLELEQYHKSGKIIPVEISVSFIRDEKHNPTRILVVSRDISERKQAEEKVKVLSHAIEQNPTMIVITDTEGNIEYTNPKFEEVTGYSIFEAKGKKPSIINSGKMPEKLYKDMWDTIKAKKVWHGELINKKKNNELFWSNLSISPITDDKGNITHFVGIQEDISERKKIEKELISAKEHAEESDRLKSAFLQNMSHEIRTPMNAIIGFSNLMVTVYNNKARLQKFAQIIENSCTTLLEIIHGILDMALIETRQLSVNYDDCDLNVLFNELYLVFNENKIKYEKQFLDFSMNYPKGKNVWIKTDIIKLKQILSNLLSNAFKFTNSGKIVGGYEFTEDQNIVFFVSDTGIGIPEDKHDVIFHRFIKLDQNENKFQEGTGLGLAIVKELVEFLGGKIWLKSKPLKGSIFYFTINCQVIQK